MEFFARYFFTLVQKNIAVPVTHIHKPGSACPKPGAKPSDIVVLPVIV
jgi:hypothetical protein